MAIITQNEFYHCRISSRTNFSRIYQFCDMGVTDGIRMRFIKLSLCMILTIQSEICRNCYCFVVYEEYLPHMTSWLSTWLIPYMAACNCPSHNLAQVRPVITQLVKRIREHTFKMITISARGQNPWYFIRQWLHFFKLLVITMHFQELLPFNTENMNLIIEWLAGQCVANISISSKLAMHYIRIDILR